VKFVKILKRVVINSDQSNESLAAIVAGTANQSELLNNKLGALIRSSDDQSQLFNAKLQEIIEQLNTLVELQRAEMELMRLILVGIASHDIDSMNTSPIPTEHTPSSIGRDRSDGLKTE
jgi:ABC-type transporter Mla subunit MlaD